MKKITFILISLSTLLFVGCQDFDYGDLPTPVDEEAINNAKMVLGVGIDTSHDWNTTDNGSITITADAELDDIAKVQILTESPFFNANARILAEVDATQGQTVTLTYDAPKTYTRLIAACVSSKGEYYIKGFDVGTTQLSFIQMGTRSVGVDSNDYPDLTKVQISFTNTTLSYNARRTILANEAAASDDATLKALVNDNHLNLWEGKHWENERLWGPDNGGHVDLGNDWYYENSTVTRVIPDIDEEEAAALQDIFDNYLGRGKVGNKRQDNMEAVRNSGVVSINHNHMVSTGVAPITITPVLMASNELNSSHLYYYYYNPSDIPSGMDEEDYLKSLPKFKAIMCHHTMAASASVGTGGSNNFFKKHEYLLPFYGDPKELIDMEGMTNLMCKTDGKFYRIRNGAKLNGTIQYMTYLGQTNNLSPKLSAIYDDNDDNVANQLWQIFTDPEGRVLLYNVGSQMYLCPYPSSQDYTVMSEDVEWAKKYAYVMNQEGDCWRFWSYNSWNESNKHSPQCLGTDLGNKAKEGNRRISTNKTGGDNICSKWYLEPYNGSKNIAPKAEFVHSAKPYVLNAVSPIIPKGYRIGFMLRKLAGSQSEKDNAILTAVKNGCCYGDRRLNKEINQFPGHFGSANTLYSMAVDDPRMAMFEVNGKAYLTFEDGSDCNFSDLIIQVDGGFASLGYIPDVIDQVYTFCFEDRDNGDYDMNDIVIKAKRIDATHILYSVEACGGMDKVYLRGIKGKILNETTELHSLFGVTGIVNAGSSHVDPVTELIEVEPSFSFSDEKKMFYIYNASTGKEIRLSLMGEDPHAIMIPDDFEYPLEGTCIKNAYPAFLNWSKDRTTSLNWYVTPEIESKVYKLSAFRFE